MTPRPIRGEGVLQARDTSHASLPYLDRCTGSDCEIRALSMASDGSMKSVPSLLPIIAFTVLRPVDPPGWPNGYTLQSQHTSRSDFLHVYKGRQDRTGPCSPPFTLRWYNSKTLCWLCPPVLVAFCLLVSRQTRPAAHSMTSRASGSSASSMTTPTLSSLPVLTQALLDK